MFQILWKSTTATALALISSIFVPPALAEPATGLTVAVSTVTDKAGNTDLRVRVKNEGSNSLELFRAGLPWGNSRSMYTQPIKNRTPLTPRVAIDDPVAGTITLNPGDELQGEINLLERFPTLRTDLQTGPLDLLWTYQATQTNGKVADRFGGWILLPQKDK